MSKHRLKQGWSNVAFGDVVQLSKKRSSDPAADGFERYVGLEHLEPGSLKVSGWGAVADGTTFTSVFQPGQILFGKRRAYQRKLAVAHFSGVCSGDIYVLEPKNDHLLAELLPFICQTDSFFDHAVGTSAGSLSPRTNWKSLATYEFALPPMEEQRRIAEVLRAAETAISATSVALDRAWSVLRSLSCIHFTPRSGKGGLLSDHYEITSGQVDPRDAPYSDLPLVAPNHIVQRTGKLIGFETAKSQGAISGKYEFNGEVVLYSKIRPELRKAVKVNCHGLCSADMYPLIPKGTVHVDYLLDLLLSDTFSVFAISGSRRTKMPKLNRTHLSKFRFKVPPMHEQELYLATANPLREARVRLLGRRSFLQALKHNLLHEVLEQ